MISYFLRTSNSDSATVFAKYVAGLRAIIADNIDGEKYSDDVEVLLIEYIYEGEYTELPEKEIRFVSYRSKEHMAIVTAGIKKEFERLSDNEKKQKIISVTSTSVDIFEKALVKKKIDVSGFERLRHDLEICYEIYQGTQILAVTET
jgi:hypothetical protein